MIIAVAIATALIILHLVRRYFFPSRGEPQEEEPGRHALDLAAAAAPVLPQGTACSGVQPCGARPQLAAAHPLSHSHAHTHTISPLQEATRSRRKGMEATSSQGPRWLSFCSQTRAWRWQLSRGDTAQRL